MSAHISNASIFIDMLWQIIIEIKWSTRINLFVICPATLLNPSYFPDVQNLFYNKMPKVLVMILALKVFWDVQYPVGFCICIYNWKCHMCLYHIPTNSTIDNCVHTKTPKSH